MQLILTLDTYATVLLSKAAFDDGISCEQKAHRVLLSGLESAISEKDDWPNSLLGCPVRFVEKEDLRRG